MSMISIDDDKNVRDVRFELEQFLHHTQYYLTQLQKIKNDLNELHRQNQLVLYIESLDEFDKTIQNLVEDRRYIDQLHLQLSDNERLNMDLQVQLIRDEIDRELLELHRLREEEDLAQENQESIDTIVEENDSSNVLRQRHVTRNPLDATYDMLEQDLIYLRQTIDDVSKLVAEQEQKLSTIELYRTMAHNRVQQASSFFSNVFHNRYVTTTAGAVIGASISGPVGFVMGTKVGALAALSGSVFGALSMSIMRHKSETDELQNNNSTAYSQAML